MSQDKSVRLNKYIAQSGICSRREADQHIENGQVKINGRRVDQAVKVKPGDKVMVNGRVIEPEEEQPLVLIALNKPVGIVSTTEESEKDNIVRFTNYPSRIFPIGRLDKDSNGLIFLTNDGDLVNKVLRAGNNHEKEYIVTVDKPITEDFIKGMSSGVPILGEMTKKCKVEKTGSHEFKIILVQGLNRQIRRMAEHFGFIVQTLQRTRIMHISLKGLPIGDFRAFEDEEIKELFRLIKNSSSETSNKPNKKVQQKPKHQAQKKKTKASKNISTYEEEAPRFGKGKTKSSRQGKKRRR